MRSCPSGAPEERGWGAAAEPIALMGPLVIVGLHKGLETALQRRPTGERAPPEGHAPILLQDRALQPLDEAIRPGAPWLSPGMAEAEGPTGRIEDSLKLGPAIGEYAAQPPARAPTQRAKEGAEEVSGRFGGVGGQQPGHAVRARSIAGRDLPNLPDALELAEVERVQTHQLAGPAGPTMARRALLGLP